MKPLTTDPSRDVACDPVGEAWRWLESALEGRPVPPLLVLIGLGEGHVLDALEQHAPATRVLAIEPDSENAPRILASRQGEAWQAGGRLVLLADPDYAGADEAWRLFPAGGERPPVLVHPELLPGPGITRARERAARRSRLFRWHRRSRPQHSQR